MKKRNIVSVCMLLPRGVGSSRARRYIYQQKATPKADAISAHFYQHLCVLLHHYCLLAFVTTFHRCRRQHPDLRRRPTYLSAVRSLCGIIDTTDCLDPARTLCRDWFTYLAISRQHTPAHFRNHRAHSQRRDRSRLRRSSVPTKLQPPHYCECDDPSRCAGAAVRAQLCQLHKDNSSCMCRVLGHNAGMRRPGGVHLCGAVSALSTPPPLVFVRVGLLRRHGPHRRAVALPRTHAQPNCHAPSLLHPLLAHCHRGSRTVRARLSICAPRGQHNYRGLRQYFAQLPDRSCPRRTFDTMPGAAGGRASLRMLAVLTTARQQRCPVRISRRSVTMRVRAVFSRDVQP